MKVFQFICQSWQVKNSTIKSRSKRVELLSHLNIYLLQTVLPSSLLILDFLCQFTKPIHLPILQFQYLQLFVNQNQPSITSKNSQYSLLLFSLQFLKLAHFKIMQKITNQIMFGAVALSPNQVFILRKNVFATVNLKPYAQGHVLVCSRRIVPKLQDLTEIQILDLFMTAQEVAKRLQIIYGREVHLTVQNGADAGQTMKHAHIHIVPGKGGVQRQNTGARTPEEMAEEAEQYRPYFEQSIQ